MEAFSGKKLNRDSGKGRMGAQAKEKDERRERRERERCDEGRGNWRGSEREKGKRRERKITLYSLLCWSERAKGSTVGG